MKNLLIIIIIGFSYSALAQMPQNGDFSNWNWENQSSNNWQRQLSAGEPDNDGVNDGWANIRPPFSPTSIRVGEIVDVFATGDYTKAKGWELVWAHFTSIYPYFVLYNEHKGLARAFFYLDGDDTFNYILANLSFHQSDNPGVLAGGNEGADATDKYLNGSQNSEDDQISVVIPNVGLQSWCSADFPIFFDNNIKNSRYNNKKWVFLFYGADNYLIKLSSTNTTPPGAGEQHSISGGSLTSSQFSAQHGKFHKQLKTTAGFLTELKNSTKNINDSSPQFLKKYKSTVDGLGNVFQIFDAAVGVSSAAGAVLGFFNLISGTFDQGSSKPQAVIQYLELEGTMDIKRTLGGTTLKIPGVNGSIFPPVAWNPYDCPVGYFNMKKTPQMSVIKPYIKLGCVPAGTIANKEWYVSGYSGRYKKYRVDSDIELVLNELEGMNLIDVHFAIVCRPTGKNDKSYSIKEPFIARYRHTNLSGQTYEASVPNPVYKDLDRGRFIIHKFDDDNDDIVFGTPYLKMNQLKGIVFELPEDTDVKIRVLAKFSSNNYSKPIIFQADYKFDVSNQNPNSNKLFCNNEQTNFRYGDYYGEGAALYSLGSDVFNTVWRADEIRLNDGFTGVHGFEAISDYEQIPNNGNTIIQRIDYNCNHSQSGTSGSRQLASENTLPESALLENLSETILVYPNPSSGYFHIESLLEQPLERVRLFNLDGTVIDDFDVESNTIDINLSNRPTGVYVIGMVYSDKVIIRRIIKE